MIINQYFHQKFDGFIKNIKIINFIFIYIKIIKRINGKHARYHIYFTVQLF